MATNSGIDEGVVALNSSTATEIVPADVRRKLLVLRNPSGSGQTEYFGSSSVTSSSPDYAPGEGIIINGEEGACEAWYGISGAGTPNVAYTEVWE